VWPRAARDALADPAIAEAARACFVAAYAALARQGTDRHLRDAVATYIHRYVSRGRTPADDLLDTLRTRPDHRQDAHRRATKTVIGGDATGPTQGQAPS
jgi:glutamate--cysteine ligase